MAKTTKRTSSAKKTKSKKKRSVLASRVFGLICLLAGILLGILAFFRLGLLGSVLFGFGSLFFGYVTYFCILVLIFLCVYALLHNGKGPSLYWLGGVSCLVMFLLLISSLPAVDPVNPFRILGTVNPDVHRILLGEKVFYGGYFGILVSGFSVILLSLVGSWMVAFLFLLLAAILIAWPYKEQILLWIHSQREVSKQERPAKMIRKKTVNSTKTEKTEKEETYPSIQEFDLDQFDQEPEEPEEIQVTRKKEPEKEEPMIFHAPVLYPDYRLPSLELFNPLVKSRSNPNQSKAREAGQKLMGVLEQFRVAAHLTDVHIGPSVTQFELALEPGIRVNTITNLQNEIKMALAATDIRIEAPIPGKNAIGIEIPNASKVPVTMRELLDPMPEEHKKAVLLFALGKDLYGNRIYGHLESMPHLLIAGATGSGKSVCVNSIITSLLFRMSPEEVKLVLIDPKKVEFAPYNGIPHLLTPVITEPEAANQALKVIVAMMDQRYDLFEEYKVRNIEGYNRMAASDPDLNPMPRIVVIIDELADLMLVASKEVEQSIQRITQLARAAGIHLIVATQRPSVNVITGVIKANIPSRIAFAVSSAVDSRTILDQSGAEKLLGYGDMLFIDNGDSAPRRIQGVFIQDNEVFAVCENIKEQAAPEYEPAFAFEKEEKEQDSPVSFHDPLYESVREFVISSRKASTSLIQRRFSIGYARAARIMDSLEKNGVIGPARGSRPREVYVQEDS